MQPLNHHNRCKVNNSNSYWMHRRYCKSYYKDPLTKEYEASQATDENTSANHGLHHRLVIIYASIDNLLCLLIVIIYQLLVN